MQSVLDIHSNDWETEIQKYKFLVLVEFWYKSCPWCLKLNPILDEVAEEYEGKVKFTRMDVLESKENRDIAIGHGIKATPTLIFFCDGRPIQTVTEFQEKEGLRQIVNDVIEKHRDCLERSTPLKTG